MAHGVLTTYRGYTLDDFQKEAIEWLSRGESLLVSAPTGTGKTLVADYLVEAIHRQRGQVVYTAPIKALSNQKFKEFKALLGEEHVGILTGDIVKNPDGSVLIMTTEIFRNLLLTDPDRLAKTRYVIFDEIHYIDDPARGSVWEESLIFMPETMRFLGLSATIPNVDELADWISHIQNNSVHVITHTRRAVPLEHHLYEKTVGICTREQLEKRYRRYASRFGTTQSGTIAAKFEPTRHIDVMRALGKDHMPCLFFTFSRRKCEMNAKELSEHFHFSTPDEQRVVQSVIEETLTRYGGAGERSVEEIKPLLMKGIAYHHAGLLPVVKDVVEDLFERRLIHVLYCTETFAVGLNFPCRTVCFDAMTKWDGETFRSLSNREYFQMAGRAGRRGIDERGYAYAAVDFNFFRPDELPSMKEEDVEPLRSRFSLSYNTVLNLVKNYDRQGIESVLSRNFARYQADVAHDRYTRELARLESARNNMLHGVSIQDAERVLDYVDKKKSLDRLYERIRRQERQRDYKGLKHLRRDAKNLRRHIGRLERGGVTKDPLLRNTKMLKEYRQVTRRIEELRRALEAVPTPDSFMNEFMDKRLLLQAMDYIREDELTARGLFAAEINGSELLITELFFQGVFHDWDEDALNALAASIGYEPRRGEERMRHSAFDLAPVLQSLSLIQDLERTYLGYTQMEFYDHVAPAARSWSEGNAFLEVLKIAATDEGDLVFSFRRAIDVIRQVRQAARQDEAMSAKLTRCIDKMDRDEVSILL